VEGDGWVVVVEERCLWNALDLGCRRAGGSGYVQVPRWAKKMHGHTEDLSFSDRNPLHP